jgi:hypothetical protein
VAGNNWLEASPEAESLDHQPSECADPHQCREQRNSQHRDAEPAGPALGCLRAGWARRINDLWAIDVKGCVHDAIAAGRDLSLSSPALVGPLWLAVQVSQKFIWMTWRVPGAFSFAPGQAAAEPR